MHIAESLPDFLLTNSRSDDIASRGGIGYDGTVFANPLASVHVYGTLSWQTEATVDSHEQKQYTIVEDAFVIEIVNDDDGNVANIGANAGSTINDVITEMYSDFELKPKLNDRLICKGQQGADVFQFKDLTVRQYLEKGHCPQLKWKFAGETGGA